MASGVDAVVWRRPLTDGERIQGWGWGWGDVGEAARWRCLSLGCTSCDRAHQFPCPPPRVLAHLHMGLGRGQVIAHLQRVFAPLLTTSIAALSTTGRDDKHTHKSAQPQPRHQTPSPSTMVGRTPKQERHFLPERIRKDVCTRDLDGGLHHAEKAKVWSRDERHTISQSGNRRRR